MKRSDRREWVKGLLAERQRRGWTYRELSRHCGLAVSTLTSWAWKLRRERSQSGGSAAFVEIGVEEADRSASLELVLGGGLVVRVPEGFDEATLERLVAVLEKRC